MFKHIVHKITQGSLSRSILKNSSHLNIFTLMPWQVWLTNYEGCKKIKKYWLFENTSQKWYKSTLWKYQNSWQKQLCQKLMDIWQLMTRMCDKALLNISSRFENEKMHKIWRKLGKKWRNFWQNILLTLIRRIFTTRIFCWH